MLAELAAAAEGAEADVYGAGGAVARLEARVAALLNKPAALLLPSGTMAQQIALRIWADRKGRPEIAFHPRCHLELHEHGAYAHLHRLTATLVGSPDALMTVGDVVAMPTGPSALLVELPQRSLGGLLPTWEALAELTVAARARGMAVHLDGARLWESQPFYGRPYAAIASLFDSVYVSFYKALGGFSGAALVGDEALIAEGRVWTRRHGGNLAQLYPFALSAGLGLNRHLHKMAAYRAKAVELAAALATIPGVVVTPNPPHTNMTHVFLPGEPIACEEAGLRLAERTGLWPFGRVSVGRLPGYSFFELTAGAATLEVSAAEVVDAFTWLVAQVSGA